MAAERPLVVDAVPISTELDMLEIRMREYAPFVKIFVIVESPMTHAGRPKPLFFAEQRQRFDKIVEEGGAKIVYAAVEGMEPDLPVGSFQNEIKQRTTISNLLTGLRQRGEIHEGSLVIQSDIDEIISRQTLDLLTSCTDYPVQMHLNVKNYRYSYNFPLLDEGYWRPRLVTIGSEQEIQYHHGRGSDWLLEGAGWHCSFCFATLDDMRAKMQNYVHNDRLRDNSNLKEDVLRGRVCRGEDPFGMYPVSQGIQPPLRYL
jgi:beta-1,4-mannosyl-glycoprotein beta-1,4-N-acetylglucosaminyltransferase